MKDFLTLYTMIKKFKDEEKQDRIRALIDSRQRILEAVKSGTLPENSPTNEIQKWFDKV